MKNFDDFPWHDANLQFIDIDRRKPGEQDIIRLLVEWPEEEGVSEIEFSDCYALNMNMNFGIIASESILHAECITDSEELITIRRDWAHGGVMLDNLKCFKITTNSTNSTILIFALSFNEV